MIRMADIGYAAGFYEGEGSFSGSGGIGRTVSITQKDIEPLIKMQNLFGGKISQSNGYNYWRVGGVKAREFLLTIFTLLSARRRAQILRNKEFFIGIDTCPNEHPYVPGSYKTEISRGKEVRVCIECRHNHYLRKREKITGLTPEEQAMKGMDAAINILARTKGISIEEAKLIMFPSSDSENEVH